MIRGSYDGSGNEGLRCLFVPMLGCPIISLKMGEVNVNVDSTCATGIRRKMWW